MEVVTTLKKIGTSRGFIIPARILKKHNIKENDKVFYEETEDGLSVRFATPSAGTIFDELHEINSLPGEEMSMENIRKNRRNKAELAW
ncbi:MAG: AbrB/MazE/SpoVT family DNA-binding domain-containing protein [Bacteroidales bacterium]|nr:AbrB/MazE/SpoVT family DNA-binding domain-containing protein [Bacteroidales bacterium]